MRKCYSAITNALLPTFGSFVQRENGFRFILNLNHFAHAHYESGYEKKGNQMVCCTSVLRVNKHTGLLVMENPWTKDI
jgi:hypothetical protein